MTADKMILIVDKPESCEECKLSMTTVGKLYCLPKDTVVSKGERDCSCPLVAVPEKIHSDEAIAAYSTGYIDGWNGCLEKMQG